MCIRKFFIRSPLVRIHCCFTALEAACKKKKKRKKVQRRAELKDRLEEQDG